MKIFRYLLVLSFLLVENNFAQLSGSSNLKPPLPHVDVNTEDDYQLEVVKHFLLDIKNPSAVKHYPITRMGDKISELLIKIMGEDQAVWSDANSDAALDLVVLAFEKPGQITNSSDHAPGATKVLLQLLSSMAQDEGLKGRIESIRQNLLSKPIP